MTRLLILLLLFTVDSVAQTAPGKYWIQFTDKNNSPFSISNPESFLSPKCIERREKFSIGFDERDIPVSEVYILQVLATGECSVHNRSKWFNAITIVTTDTTLAETIADLPFVADVKSVEVYKPDHFVSDEKELKFEKSINVLKESGCVDFGYYGPSFRQIEMLNGHLMHQMGFTGDSIDIAQFDAGWTMTDKLPAFADLRDAGKIVMTRDFVFHDQVYNYSTHGTFVLSTMAGHIPDSLLGTAPDANYYLFRTEDPFSEFIVEEDNWVAAAELADSLGVDIINSSLGYSNFEDDSQDHSYADMDGNTTRCSIAADIAAEKGILVVNSAGNSGNNSWHYITAPSDGDSVLCVGAVNADMEHAGFSSYGPASDGDVKPDVVTMGQATVYAALDSTISTGNGTSFASPIMAGMAACLMQAFPDKSNMEILEAIRTSASLRNSPNDSLGYGIPDLIVAWLSLTQQTNQLQGDFEMMLYPNPCVDHLQVFMKNNPWCEASYEIYDASGRRVYADTGVITDKEIGVIHLDQAVKSLSQGNYVLHIGHAGRHSVMHFQKIKP